MCGILLHYQGIDNNLDDEFIELEEDTLSRDSNPTSSNKSKIFNKLIPYIINRGPNYASIRNSSKYGISWFSSILSLRDPLTRQSVKINDRFVLQYNGELYNSSIQHNDTLFVAGLIERYQDDIPKAIREMEGEFAYTIFDKQCEKLYFGRDTIGKRSLSYKFDSETSKLFISSVSGTSEGFENCEGGTIYIYDSKTGNLEDDLRIRDVPYIVSCSIDEEMCQINENIELLFNELSEAVCRRVESIHPLHRENTPISILFSGGLDCSVIAALICEQIIKSGSDTVIELLNVGFENPRTKMKPEQAPDRILAKNSATTLRKLYPTVKIILIEVDVPYEEYLEQRGKVVDLIYPKQTEMDLSIAVAFYFASKGDGFSVAEDGTREPYHRKGIVLFSGLGADELYGGYHKLANKSAEELANALTLQINNIHDRNLNRDDKVIASNGVEVRYPFLDEKVVQFSTELPINYKVNKKILRDMALMKLKLEGIAEEPKRAIQFGAKSAKMTKDGNKHGTDLLK